MFFFFWVGGWVGGVGENIGDVIFCLSQVHFEKITYLGIENTLDSSS